MTMATLSCSPKLIVNAHGRGCIFRFLRAFLVFVGALLTSVGTFVFAIIKSVREWCRRCRARRP